VAGCLRAEGVDRRQRGKDQRACEEGGELRAHRRYKKRGVRLKPPVGRASCGLFFVFVETAYNFIYCNVWLYFGGSKNEWNKSQG
jgi:hypothetical protein